MDLQHFISVDTLYKYPLTIVIALIVIAICVFASITVYLVILFSRMHMEHIRIRTNEARELISDKLYNYLYFMEGGASYTG